ncbi:Hypothetical_protein [Hexamita inflata]|uniref:Hypothetical_protein n=1 Tax=Hexamita inflata TaxID=28002 RepID=A0AA86QJ80_9EUKA|nr:Hypothetical protein HINF_LOCUS44937 [Hexamita inflata]
MLIPVNSLLIILCKVKYQRQRINQIKTLNNVEPDEIDGITNYVPILTFRPCANIKLQLNQSKIHLLSGNNLLYTKDLLFNLQSECVNKLFTRVDSSRFLRPRAQTITLHYPSPFTSNICIYKNNVYFSLFDLIFKLQNMNLNLIASIPNYTDDDRINNGNLFVTNEQMFFQTMGSLFEVKRSKIILIKKQEQRYYQFCDKIIAINSQGLSEVQGSSEQKLNCQLNEPVVIYSQGVLIIDIKPHSASVVIPHCLFQFTKLQGSFFCDDWQGHRLLSQSGILLVLSDLQLFRQLCISSFVSWLCVY